ncbi:MAG TPA: helix-turn-helix transcriptional regulator [Fimbriimonadaceae bacterium]|nr:helix-turn-helix transcriptional regulator [Fimbriimonadaceae bacterium]
MKKPEEIGATLRCARKAAGLSVARTSVLVGLSPATVKRWERGEGLPSARDLGVYLDRLGAPADSPVREIARVSIDDLSRNGGERPVLRFLRAARRRKGITLPELSAATGVSAASLHRYETGERVPESLVRRTIGRALGCNDAELEMLDRCLDEPGFRYDPTDAIHNRFFIAHGPAAVLPFARADALLRGQVVSPAFLADMLQGLIIMGDHGALLELWTLIKPTAEKLDWPDMTRALVSGYLSLARVGSETMHQARERTLRRYREYESIPPGPRKLNVGLILSRIAVAANMSEEAAQWVSQYQCESGLFGDGEGYDVITGIHLRALMADFAPSIEHFSVLQSLRSSTQGILMAYNADIAMLSVAHKLGNEEEVRRLIDQCRNTESMYGIGSPLRNRIAQDWARQR